MFESRRLFGRGCYRARAAAAQQQQQQQQQQVGKVGPTDSYDAIKKILPLSTYIPKPTDGIVFTLERFVRWRAIGQLWKFIDVFAAEEVRQAAARPETRAALSMTNKSA